MSKLLDALRRASGFSQALAASRDPEHVVELERLGDRSAPSMLADGAIRRSDSEAEGQ
jgi:hypothetical protein